MAPVAGGGGRGAAARLWLVVLALATLVPGLGLVAPSAGAAQDVAQAFVDDDDLGWGETTTVHGSGFRPGEPVQLILYAGGILLGEPIAAEDGTITHVIRIPEGIGSSTEYRLAVQGPALDGSIGYVEVPLTIRGPEPTMSVASRELRWDETTTVRGARWEPGTVVDVSLAPATQVLASATVAGDGTFEVAVQIPSGLPSSPHYQLVTTGQGIDKLFHYVPVDVTIIGLSGVITVSESELAWEQTTVVHGERFLPGTTAQIHLLPHTILLGEVQIGADGTFDAVVRIPSNVPTARTYHILVTGAGADSQFNYLTFPITIIGDRPSIDVTSVPGQRALEVEGRRFQAGSEAVLTLLPGHERLGEVVVGDDGSFSVRVRVPTDVLGEDPHLLVVTGQGADGLFAYLATEVTVGAGDTIGVGSTVRPSGDRPPPTERAARAQLRSPIDSLRRDLRQRPLSPESEGADELFLALFLLLFFAATFWFLRYSLQNDVGEALHRQRLRLQQRLGFGSGR